MIFRINGGIRVHLGLAGALVLLQTAFPAHADLVLETETAELGKRGATSWSVRRFNMSGKRTGVTLGLP